MIEGRKDNSVFRGTNAAIDFTTFIEREYGGVFNASPENEDIDDHVDFYYTTPSNKKIKIDFKSIKFISAFVDEGFGDYPPDAYNILEKKNVSGNNGWLYGKADYICFETCDSWLIVPRLFLVKFAEEKVDWGARAYPEDSPEYLRKLCTPASYLKGFQRPNRKDLITVIKKEELIELSVKIIKKPMQYVQ